MGRLSSRGWTTRSPTISADEADAFVERCQESHTAQWKVDVHRWEGGENVTLAHDVPIVGGTLTLDSSDPIRRRLTLEVGVGAEWYPYDKDSPLVPFGQFVHLFVRIDRRGGGWFPWLKLFEGPIQSNVYERPTQISTVEAADASQVVDDFLYLKRRAYAKGRTLKAVLKEIVDDALPGALYGVEASTASETTELPKAFHVEAGRSRLEAANELAGKHDQEVFFDGIGNLIIRRDLTDEDDEDWNPSEPGPDIGTVSNPVCTFADGPGGNLIGHTATIAREGAVNRVQINRTAVVNRRKSGAAKAVDKELWYSTSAQASGTVAFGDSFGRLPLVETESVPKLTAQVKANADRRAKRLLHRRRGLLKYLDADVLPQYWAEPDDKVRIVVAGTQEHHYVQRVELPLTGGPMRVRTRTLSVTDPGSPPEPAGDWRGDLAALPPRLRVMVDADYTTPLGSDGFVPTGSDYDAHSAGNASYHIERALFSGHTVFDMGAVWDCAWGHAYGGDLSGAVFWNSPVTDEIWTGSATCEGAKGAHTGPATGPTPVGWSVATYSSGGLNWLAVATRSLSAWIDYNRVLTTRLGGPSNGHPEPEPPPGQLVEWEHDYPTVTKIEAAIAEPASAPTNAGTIYVQPFSGSYGTGYGPNPANTTQWSYGRAAAGQAILPGYSGGTAAWVDVTSRIAAGGKTWFLFVSDVLEDSTRHWTGGRPPGDGIVEQRAGVMLAFRFTVQAARYRFVPVGGG